jgi:hypothetical protein
MSIANAHEQRIDWRNEHGTARQRNVTRYLPIASSGDALARWRRVGSVLSDVVGHAFKTEQPLRPDGSRWSLSRIGVPTRLAVSLAAHDVLEAAPKAWLTPAYETALASRKLTPMLVSGSMTIRRLNELLALRDLALQTSGASDGQTLAGATATGTHGAAIRFGALHDSLRAVHLMVAPDRALLVQPASAPLTATAASTLGDWLGVPTTLLSDDALFHAAIVHLGSLGLLLNAIVEVEPLYYLTSVTTPHSDDSWKKLLTGHDPGVFAGHPGQPWHVQAIVNPYAPRPRTAARAWVISMTKMRFQHQAGVDTRPEHPTRPNPDLLGLLSGLGNSIDFNLANSIFQKRITAELTGRFGAKKRVTRGLPGVIFGPSALPKGQGHSVEFVVDAALARPAVDALLAELAAQLDHGRQYLGGIGVRFVGKSQGTLAPNTRGPSCFIELPAIRSKETTRIFRACGKALSRRGIAFGVHWGQYLTGLPQALRHYWAPSAAAAWRVARSELLDTPCARKVFASPILAEAGLE